jgi:hypothetical protein
LQTASDTLPPLRERGDAFFIQQQAAQLSAAFLFWVWDFIQQHPQEFHDLPYG